MNINIKNKKVLLITIAAVICIAGGLFYMNIQSGLVVETTTVENGEIKQYIDDTAVVQSNKKQTVYVEGTGKINLLNVNIGDYVKQGDVLLSQDITDLELQLKDADAKISSAKAQLQSTDSSNYSNKIEIAEAAVETAKINCEAAKREFNNYTTLYEAGAISQQELTKVEEAYKSAQASLKSAESQLKEAKDGAPDYMKSGYLAAIEQAEILKASIEKNIQKQQVISPIDGIILDKFVEINSIPTAGSEAFLIGDTKSLELEANILSDDIYKIKIGNEVEVSGKAIGDLIIKGKVIKIAPEAKNITSSLGVNQKRVLVTIEIIDENNLLKPGYDLDAKIITEIKSDTLIVPDSAVFDYKGNSCVFTVENGKAVIKQITKGIEGEKTIEVLGGLNEGDKIIVKPDNNVTEGMKIKNQN